MKEESFEEQAPSQGALKDISTTVIKIRPKSRPQETNELEMSLSSNTLKHKLPEIILKYIIQQAKQKRNEKKPYTAGEKLTMVASKITKTKKRKEVLAYSKCDICEMEVPENQKQIMSDCPHKYCASCLHQYIIFKISKFESVECPHEGCNKVLDEKSKCYAELPLDARKKYRKLKLYTESLKDPNVKLCPNEDCEGILKVQQVQQGVIRIANPKCTHCQKVYCSKCSFEEHEGECDPHQLMFFQTTLLYRQCAKCKNVIEKSSGCNHMTCRCKYQFCYVCGGKWSSGHVCNNPNQEPIRQQEAQCCGCTCCDDCEYCEAFQLCLQNCCECCCIICDPFCNIIRGFCDACDQSECECCGEGGCCEVILKILFCFVWVIILLPLLTFQFIFLVLIRFIGGILYGLFAFPCLLQLHGYDVQCKHIIIGLLLLPFTMIFFIGLGMATMFSQEGRQQLYEVLCLPYQIFQEFICQ